MDTSRSTGRQDASADIEPHLEGGVVVGAGVGRQEHRQPLGG
ncbi:MAG: hypothetical protein U0R78_05250 [Nocardioidaceae bacterium]